MLRLDMNLVWNIVNLIVLYLPVSYTHLDVYKRQESIPAANWRVKQYTYDLHNDPMGQGNVMTEYEEKFSSMGNPIFKLVADR